MYTVAVSLVVGLVAGLLVGLRYSLPAMILIGAFAAILVFFLITRRMVGKLQTLQKQAIKQLEAQKFDLAIRTLENGAAMNRWLVVGQNQLNGQIGQIHYMRRDYGKAFSYLKDSFSRDWMAQALLAACYYRRKEHVKMEEALERAARSNKKTPLIWGVYAYLMSAVGKKDRALEILNRATKTCPDDKAIKANILQLQNKKKMKMAKFVATWYQIGLESPPQRMIQAAQPRFSALRRQKKMR